MGAKYDFLELNGASSTVKDVNDDAKALKALIDELLGIDSRVKDKYPVFSELKTVNDKLAQNIVTDGDSQSWLDNTIAGAQAVEQQNQQRDPGFTDIGDGVGTGGGTGSGTSLDTTILTDDFTDGEGNILPIDFGISPEEWSKLPPGEKEAIVKKLKELGFTDDEIKRIIDGEPIVPKLIVENVSGDLEELYKKNPSLRQKLKDLYGFDIFNDDGTINKDKLAIALLIDKKNPNDQYDLQTMIQKLKKPLTVNPVDGDVNFTPDPSPSTEPGLDTTPISTIVSGGGAATGTMGAANAAEAVADAIATEQEKDLAGLLGDLTGSVGKIGKAIAPTGGVIPTNQSGAGIIAGAGLAAAGALGGGGLYAHHNLIKLTFSPDDFYALDDDDQNAITNDMKKAGYTEDEIAKFKESDFSVDDSFISDIVKAVKKAAEINDDVKSQIRDAYGYDLLDALSKVDKYKLFATALIDGKNASDDFNLFNILNPFLADTDLTNLTYFGTIMEEVLLTEEVAKRLGVFDKLGKTYKFTEADYENQDDYTKSAIVSTLTAAGLNSEEIEKMKTATFKVKTSIMNPIINVLEDINKVQSNFAQKLTDLYKYSLIDAEGKVDKYRLFTAMIIDGYSLVDDYNIYKVVVEATGDEKKSDPNYDGLKIEDVIVDKEKEEEISEAENLGHLNVTEDELLDDGMSVAEAAVQEMKDSNPTTEKDWLKDLGIQ